MQAEEPAEQAVSAAAQLQDSAAHSADRHTIAEQLGRAVHVAALPGCWQVPEPAGL